MKPITKKTQTILQSTADTAENPYSRNLSTEISPACLRLLHSPALCPKAQDGWRFLSHVAALPSAAALGSSALWHVERSFAAVANTICCSSKLPSPRELCQRI